MTGARGALRILAPGVQLLVEDRGRPGHGALGVARSGAADPAAFAAANRLVGNRADAAGLELLAGGLELVAVGAQVLAITGRPGALERLLGDGRAVGAAAWSLVTLADGEGLRVGVAADGVRSWVAVRGGVDVPATFGSRSTDVLAGLGPTPVAAGAELPIADAAAEWPAIDWMPPPAVGVGPVVLTLLPGPRRALLAETAPLVDEDWIVEADSDRSGIRFAPASRARLTADARGLASEPMVPGAVQVPPGGHPVLFLVDHPATGGYPVPFVLRSADIGLAAQLRPGDVVRFRIG